MPTDNPWIRRISASVLGLVLFGMVSNGHSQTTRYVAPGGSDTGDCSSPANPCESIVHAFAEAAAGDVIDIATGVYRPNPGPPASALIIDKDITLQGAGPENTLVGRNSQDSAYRVFEITAGGHEVTMAGLLIANGQAFGSGADGRGGGIYNLNDGGHLTLSNVKFQNNQARIGGGLNNFNGASVTMENVVFESNQADARGGAIYNWTGGAIEINSGEFELNTAGIFAGAIFNNSNNILKLDDVTFDQNHGVSGCGAIAMNNADPATLFNDTLFIGNTTGGIGGGTCLDNSSPTLSNVSFTNNQALDTHGSGFGGGMRNVNSSSPVLNQVTFTGNNAASHGGGIYNSGNSSPQLTHVKFIANGTGGGQGGGMANLDASNPMLTDVTFESNTAGLGGGMSNDGGSSPTLLKVRFLDNFASTGGGLHNMDNSQPLLMNVEFIDNLSQGQGGGMANFNSSPTVINGLFYDNFGQQGGGGILNGDNSLMTLWNVTFNANMAELHGGAIRNRDGAQAIIHNSIFWGNLTQFTDFSSEIQIQGDSQVSMHYSLHDDEDDAINVLAGSSFSCNNCLTDNPQFVDDLNGDLRLMLTSPAIDAGNPDTDLSQFPGGPDDPIDLLGWSRLFGTQIDIGAYEWQPPPDSIFSDRFKYELP